MGRRDRTTRTELTTAKACQVVPEIPSFAVDDGFTYIVPERMEVRVGSRVRIRVSGRRLKGFVTSLFDARPERSLLPIDGVSGTVASFDERSLDVLRSVASHYVTPLSTILGRTLPPNLPRAGRFPPRPPKTGNPSFGVIVSNAQTHASHISSIVAEAFDNHLGAIVIVPTITEAATFAGTLAHRFGDAVVAATSASSAKEATRAWVKAATAPPVVLVGTREIMLWPVAELGVAVIVEDARRVMKSPSTPTLSVRDVVVRRARAEGFDVTFIGPVPTLESLALGAVVESPPGRQWPLVEVADRAEEPPSRSILLDRTRAALTAVVNRGARAFVLVPVRGYAPAFRCVRCGELRRCEHCGTAATRQRECRRCGASLAPCPHCNGERFEALGAGIGSVRDAVARSVGDSVGVLGENKPVTVGSERDLVAHPLIDLAVAVDVDGLSLAPTYRAAEDALRLLVRLANLVQRGRGNRLLIQTALTDQPVIAALRSGRSDAFLAAQLAERARSSFPPVGELITLEIDRTIEVGSQVLDSLDSVASVLGPAETSDRDRWLIQAGDLTEARARLRRLVGSLRDRGARVRVDADPIDL